MDLLPDVMNEKSIEYLPLQWVGMTQIQTAMQIGAVIVPVRLDVGVNLNQNHRGIHMSRLYQLHQLHILNQKISDDTFKKYLQSCLDSHTGLSQVVSAQIRLQWPMMTRSLKSQLAGFRQYPVEIIIEQHGLETKYWLQFEILYSSTCPQSAKVSLEVIKSADQVGPFEFFLATPHAQRSRAQVRVQLSTVTVCEVEKLIIETEKALGTPVQTTVKKIDEMEFAKLNAQNLMFCEDAARKLSVYLKSNQTVQGFSVLCEHQESLHPHNASAINAHSYSSPANHQFAN